MGKIISMNGYIYEVDGARGFEVYQNLGKDINDPMWENEIKEMNLEKKTKKTQKKEID